MMIDIKSKCEVDKYPEFNDQMKQFTGAMDDDELKTYSDV